jgi:uncharacterized protein DUF4404
MSESRLRELLARLREHLHTGTPVRDSERALLDKAMNTLGGGDPSSPGTLLRLERLAVRFEVSHPALAETLREISDTLGKGGI